MEEDNSKRNDNEVVNNNKKNTIIVILAVLAIALICTVIYFVFIKKEDKPTDNSGNNQQQENNNQSKDETSKENKTLPNDGMIYKNNNGSKVLKIFNIDDNFKKKYPNEDLSEYLYYGEYNNEVIIVDKVDNVGDYTVYSGELLGGMYYSCDFVVKGNELLDLEYNIKEIIDDAPGSCEYSVKHIGNKYYILVNSKELYDENLNKLYDLVIGSDKNNNFYVFDKGYFKKVNQDGEVIKTGNNKLSYSRHIQELITDDNLYTIAFLDKKVVFYDLMSDKTIELGSSVNYSLCANEQLDLTVHCGMMAGVSQESDKLKIYIIDNNNNEKVLYYNTETNLIEK